MNLSFLTGRFFEVVQRSLKYHEFAMMGGSFRWSAGAQFATTPKQNMRNFFKDFKKYSLLSKTAKSQIAPARF